MKRNGRKRIFAWLMVVMQLLTCFSDVSLADEQTDTVFTASEYVGGYTVAFLDLEGEPIYTVEDVEYETEMSGLFDDLYEAYPDAGYDEAVWSVSRTYLVLNNLDVQIISEDAVAKVGDQT